MSDHWQLGIESSGAQADVALARGGEVVAQAAVGAEQNHSAVMPGPLREILGALPAGARLEVVVIGTGPGSYNGARVGIAAGQGVALVHACPAVGVCSLEGVAAVQQQREPCLAVGDARRDTYFTLTLAEGRLSGKVELLGHDEFVSRVAATAARLLSFENPERLGLPDELAARVEVVETEARLLLAAWNEKSEKEREALLKIPPEPFYLREPYVTTAKGAMSPGG